MSKIPEYEIGEWVHVKKTVHFHSSTMNTRIYTRLVADEYGQIIGATYRQTGDYCSDAYHPIHHKANSLYDPDSYIGARPFLSVKKTYLVWKIAIGYTNKHLEALPEDVKKVEFKEDEADIPWRRTKYHQRLFVHKSKR